MRFTIIQVGPMPAGQTFVVALVMVGFVVVFVVAIAEVVLAGVAVWW